MDESSPHHLICFYMRRPTKLLGAYPVLLFSLGSHTQDKVSDQPPAGPELMDGVEDPHKPNPPVLETKVDHLVFIFGSKQFSLHLYGKMNQPQCPMFAFLDKEQRSNTNEVVPDMEKFMETVSGKISVINDMIETLADKRNPPPLERYALSLYFYSASLYICSIICVDLFLKLPINLEHVDIHHLIDPFILNITQHIHLQINIDGRWKNNSSMARYFWECCLVLKQPTLFSFHHHPFVYICKLRISDDLKKINSKLSGCFKQMASYMTEIKLHNLDKTKEDNPKLLEFPRLYTCI